MEPHKSNDPYRTYTPEELFQMLKEHHRLQFDLPVEIRGPDEITKDMTIKVLRKSWFFSKKGALGPYPNFYYFLKADFNISVDIKELIESIEPEKKKTVWDLCVFTSKHTNMKKAIIVPHSILGQNCLTAAVFLTFKKYLQQVNLNVENLWPSTLLSEFLNDDNICQFAGMISWFGPELLDTIEVNVRDKEIDDSELSFWQRINPFRIVGESYYVAGNVKTFRDLSVRMTERLIETAKKQGTDEIYFAAPELPDNK